MSINDISILTDLTVKQTANFFQVSRVTIHRMLNRGELDSYKFGNSRRIRKESIERVRDGVVNDK